MRENERRGLADRARPTRSSSRSHTGASDRMASATVGFDQTGIRPNPRKSGNSHSHSIRLNEKDHRSDRWSQKPQWLLHCIASNLWTALAAATGLMLALHWPSDSGLWTSAVWTSVPSDACHHRHWSLSALVTTGAGRCEKPPLDQPIDPTPDETAGSYRRCRCGRGEPCNRPSLVMFVRVAIRAVSSMARQHRNSCSTCGSARRRR